MESLSKDYNSKKKGYLKSYMKQIEMFDISLSNKIQYAIQKYESIIFPFINEIYALNSEPLAKDYKRVSGDRLQKHRNAFAHGNIEQEIDSNIILDLNIVQWVVHCIVLEAIGFEEKEMKKIIHYFNRGNIHNSTLIDQKYDEEEEEI